MLQFLALNRSLLVVHVTEIPCHLDIDHGVAPVLLITPEGIALGIVLPFAGVEDIAPVEGYRHLLIEEVLADTEVERGIGLAMTLGDDTT